MYPPETDRKGLDARQSESFLQKGQVSPKGQISYPFEIRSIYVLMDIIKSGRIEKIYRKLQVMMDNDWSKQIK